MTSVMDGALADVMQEVRPGLWWWTAPHPDWSPWDPGTKTGWDWDRAAGCACYQAPEGLVLVDPLAPPVGTPAHEAFWRALDGEAQRRDRPVAVLLTCDWHDRSAQAVFDRYHARYGASIWVPAACVPQGSSGSLNCRPTHTFQEGDPLPGGAEAYLAAWNPEVLIYLPTPRALFVADSLWSPPDAPATEVRLTQDRVRPVLRRVLETRPVDVALLSHGRPVVERANEVLTRVMEQPKQPPWDE